MEHLAEGGRKSRRGEESELTGEEAQDEGHGENFTPEEWKRLKGVSNGGYHYLGAAKIMAPIGKAFAEAMVKLQKPQRQEKQ